MIEELFPVEIGRAFTRSIQRNVVTVRNRYGFIQNSSNDPDGGLRAFGVNRRLISDSDYNEIRDFHIGTNHGAEGFLFKDWKDYAVTEGYIGTGDGSEDSFDLIRRYELGTGVDIDRRVLYPVGDDLDAVYFDDVEQLSGWSWNTTTKQIDFTSPVTDTVVITADFEFYIPVIFAAELSSSNDYLSVNNYETINLQEIIVDV